MVANWARLQSSLDTYNLPSHYYKIEHMVVFLLCYCVNIHRQGNISIWPIVGKDSNLDGGLLANPSTTSSIEKGHVKNLKEVGGRQMTKEREKRVTMIEKDREERVERRKGRREQREGGREEEGQWVILRAFCVTVKTRQYLLPWPLPYIQSTPPSGISLPFM